MKKITFLGITLLALMPFTLFAQSSGAFVTTWNSSPASASTDHEIRFYGVGNGYTIHWQEVSNPGHSGAVTAGNIAEDQFQLIDFGTAGQYKVWVDPSETGTFQQFKQRDDNDKLVDIAQWGNTTWTSFYQAFRSCPNVDMTATDAPDLTHVTTMEDMFAFCTSLVANSTINTWNTSTVTNMNGLFRGTEKFNQSLNNWNTSNVTTMANLFSGTIAFNGNITGWNTGSVTNMQEMFSGALAFNQPIESWDTHSLENIDHMFYGTKVFNQSLEGWNTTHITSMANTFAYSQAFNGGLNTWDLSNVTSVSSMFEGAQAFNQPLNNWNTVNVTNMSNLFHGAIQFNGDINNWNVSQVTNMSGLFDGAEKFNQPLNNWNTALVTDVSNMFHNASNFNQPLSNWNMSSITTLNSSFDNATAFNQDISNWNNKGLGNSGSLQLYSFLNNSAMNCVNYSMWLNGLAANTGLPSGVGMDAKNIVYNSSALTAHNYLTTTKSWTIVDDIYMADCNGTVPVTLEVFNATYEAPFTVLRWTTGVEDDLAYFEVQQSLDGKTFKTIQKTSRNTGNPAYSCRLEGPAGLTYYRLKIVESTGKITYSETRTVSVPSSVVQIFSLHPNPVRSNSLHVLVSSKRSIDVKIYNQLGQLVGHYSLEPGDNNIKVSNLPSGVYWLRGASTSVTGNSLGSEKNEPVSGTRIQSQKFIIQH